MKKARFLQKQPPVNIVERDRKVYIYLCLNGKQVEEEIISEENKSRGKIIVWEYDYNEIIENSNFLDINDIKKNPNNYINYTAQKQHAPTLEEQINILTKENSLLKKQMETTQQAIDFLLLGTV